MDFGEGHVVASKRCRKCFAGKLASGCCPLATGRHNARVILYKFPSTISWKCAHYYYLKYRDMEDMIKRILNHWHTAEDAVIIVLKYKITITISIPNNVVMNVVLKQRFSIIENKNLDGF